LTTKYGTGTGIPTTGLGGGTGVPITPPAVPSRDGDAIFGNALRDIFDSPLGDDAVYTPSGGTAIACRVLIDRSVMLQPTGMVAQVFERGTTIEAILADIGKEPNRGDTFVIGTETFTVQAIDSTDGLTVTMVVT
jgi:hypothetical protein